MRGPVADTCVAIPFRPDYVSRDGGEGGRFLPWFCLRVTPARPPWGQVREPGISL